jgi:hypothetical protein
MQNIETNYNAKIIIIKKQKSGAPSGAATLYCKAAPDAQLKQIKINN